MKTAPRPPASCTHHNPTDCPHTQPADPQHVAVLAFAILAAIALQFYSWNRC